MRDTSRPLYTAEQVTALLYDAGLTLMALHVPGCWPSGFRSCMPASAIEPDDLATAATSFSPAHQPSGREIDAMDRAYAWVNRLPWQTPVELRAKRLVLDRMRVSPKTGRVLFNWSRLGARHGISHTWAKTVWLAAVEQITAIANAPPPTACAATFARIRAQAVANRLGAAAPAPLSEVERFKRLVTRPRSAPCTETIRRIAASEVTKPAAALALETA